jgi:hypothetical protein
MNATPPDRFSVNVRLRGVERAAPERLALCAGPLRMWYEAGDLRWIRLGEHEVVRRIYAAVRDRNWDTIVGELQDVVIEAGADTFAIRYRAEHRAGDIDFGWCGRISGDPNGELRFEFDGEARTSFLKNRVGFCVLHPLRECVGKWCRVEYLSGDIAWARLPELVAAEQPVARVHDLRAIAHHVSGETWAEVRFEGDSFEMEDQRNWTDASFKTFCTPLRIPLPARVEAGRRIRQSVTLRLRSAADLGAIPEAARGRSAAVAAGLSVEVTEGGAITLAPVGGRLRRPLLGLSSAPDEPPLGATQTGRLRALGLDHLRLELAPSQPGWQERTRHGCALAAELGVKLEVALVLGADAANELEEARAALAGGADAIARWLLLTRGAKSTRLEHLRLGPARLAPLTPGVPIGGGTEADFYQLNEQRPAWEAMDFVAFSMNPQVHAFDEASMVETLEAQPAPVRAARAAFNQLPVVVTPVTLRARYNPVASGPGAAGGVGGAGLPRDVDPRQSSLFGAVWTLGSVAALAVAEVEAVTYYETSGWRGVLEREAGAPEPARFHSVPGGVYPLYHVFRDLAGMTGELVSFESSERLWSVALGSVGDGRRRLLVGNLSAATRQFVVRRWPGAQTVRRMDASNVVAAMTDPERFSADRGERVVAREDALRFELGPYAYARLDAIGT